MLYMLINSIACYLPLLHLFSIELLISMYMYAWYGYGVKYNLILCNSHLNFILNLLLKIKLEKINRFIIYDFIICFLNDFY